MLSLYLLIHNLGMTSNPQARIHPAKPFKHFENISSGPNEIQNRVVRDVTGILSPSFNNKHLLPHANNSTAHKQTKLDTYPPAYTKFQSLQSRPIHHGRLGYRHENRKQDPWRRGSSRDCGQRQECAQRCPAQRSRNWHREEIRRW
jgi:hypothetical protein